MSDESAPPELTDAEKGTKGRREVTLRKPARARSLAADGRRPAQPRGERPEAATPAGDSSALPAAPDLNVCARQLLAQLEPQWRDWIEQVAMETLKVPVWQVVCGVILQACDRSEVPAATIDARWKPEGTSEVTSHICPVCERPFIPKAYGQVVCGNKCGVIFEEEMMGVVNPNLPPKEKKRRIKVSRKKTRKMVHA